MKKQLNTATMENELKGSSVFFQKSTTPENGAEDKKTRTPLPSLTGIPSPTPPEIKPEAQELEINQSVNQSIDQSTHQSTKQLTGRTVNRPVAFYIPEVITKKIDEAIQYYQDKRRLKFDRSAIVSAILGNPQIWTEQALDRLIDQVTEQLTSRLTSRLSD